MATELEIFDEMDACIGALHSCLDRLSSVLTMLKEERSRGVSLLDIYRSHGLREARDDVFEHLTSFERAFTALRAWGVRTLVDDEGLTLTEVSQATSRSEQFTSRLYKSHANAGEHS